MEGAERAGKHPPEGCSEGSAETGWWGTLWNHPGPAPSLPKPPEAPTTPMPRFPLRVGTRWPASPEAKDTYVKAPWKLKPGFLTFQFCDLG